MSTTEWASRARSMREPAALVLAEVDHLAASTGHSCTNAKAHARTPGGSAANDGPHYGTLRLPPSLSTTKDGAAPWPSHLTQSQKRAREAFDLDAAYWALPAAEPRPLNVKRQGTAGSRLTEGFVANIHGECLREAARDILGAKRMSDRYLKTLRVVLGNQADAERRGYVLELNRRVEFAPPRVMRTIVDQMRRAGLTFDKRVSLGGNRTQVIQCYAGTKRSENEDEAAAVLEFLLRKEEAEADARLGPTRPRVDPDLRAAWSEHLPY